MCYVLYFYSISNIIFLHFELLKWIKRVYAHKTHAITKIAATYTFSIAILLQAKAIIIISSTAIVRSNLPIEFSTVTDQPPSNRKFHLANARVNANVKWSYQTHGEAAILTIYSNLRSNHEIIENCYCLAK